MRVQKIARKLGRLFCRILGWPFLGDVLEFYFGARRNRYSGDFGEMEQHRMPQKIAQKLGRLFCRILGWRFLGDVLNTEWTTEKHYSTLEFKVIYSIVSIYSSICAL